MGFESSDPPQDRAAWVASSLTHRLDLAPAARPCGPKDSPPCGGVACADCSGSVPGCAVMSGPTLEQSASPVKRVASCRNCGNDPHAVVRAFAAGVQAAYWESYIPNVQATEARERAEAERQNHERWHE